MDDQDLLIKTPEAVTFTLPPLVEWKCPKGHIWTIVDNEGGTFVTFTDANGQKAELNICPFCFADFFTANGMMMEKHAITEELAPTKPETVVMTNPPLLDEGMAVAEGD